jgi:hypothetical protein
VQPTNSVVGVFTDFPRAQQAVAALHAAGVAPERITLAGDASAARIPAMGRPGERESPFMLRLVLIIVFWSIVGTAVGLVMGLVFGAVGIGPQGVAGLLIQTVSWAIFAHLIAGIWAGYALLANRGSQQQPVRTAASAAAPGRVLMRVACTEPEVAAVEAALRDSGASRIGRYAADGSVIAAG